MRRKLIIRRRQLACHLAAWPALLLLGSCVAASEPPQPVRTAAPAPAITPPPLAPARPADLVFAGELTQGGWLRGTVPPGTAALTLNGKPVEFGSDGRFFLAFDRDAGADHRLMARLADGRTIERGLIISPRAWNIEHINAARSGSGPSEAFQRLRAPELAAINAARRIRPASDGWRQDFIWPVTGRISGRFGSQRVYRGEPGSYHSGIDIATGGSGAPFVAPADGVVILATDRPFTLEGYLLMIDHGNGLNSAFLHCSEILVRTGDTVRQGQTIGRIGATGRATGPHLHWGMKWNDARIDPILLTGPMTASAAGPRVSSPAAP